MNRAYYQVGTRRTLPPSATLERVRPLLGQFGITRLANITGLDRIGIPVVTAIRPSSRALAVAQGKGATLADANASAVMESVEMLHAERPALPLRLASMADLEREGATVVAVDRLPRVRPSQLRRQQALLWASGTNLANQRTTLVPYAYVAVDDSLEALPMPASVPSNSNGLASGNTLPEASVHALCELVERDASTLWLLDSEAGRATTAIDLDSVSDGNCRSLLDRYRLADIDVCAFDITSDVGIPAFTVFIRERASHRGAEQSAATGSGCHPWPEIALSRALTEAAQCRLTTIAGAREDLERTDYGANDAKRADVERYFAAGMRKRRPFDTASYPPSDPDEGFEETIERILTALSRVGLDEVVVVDLTAERFGIPVVRALVPGLEGVLDEPGYVPQFRASAVISASGDAS